MKVLHLFSNYRWTGPAEPAVRLAAGLRERGLDVEFACGPSPHDDDSSIARRAVTAGLPVRTDLQLPKHLSLRQRGVDAAALAADLDAGRYDLLHCHLRVDHITAHRAVRRARGRVPVVRCTYEGPDYRPDAWFERPALRAAATILAPSQSATTALRSRFSQVRVEHLEGAIDLDRFDPSRPLSSLRPAWGADDSHVVIGVIARMQAYRRFDQILEAFRQASQANSQLRLVLIGRGTKEEEVVRQPIRELGLTEAAIAPGYYQGDEFVAALQSMDALLYWVPGSDRTCRTVREALATGVPALVARRGVLPELVKDGETGSVVEPNVDALAQAMLQLAADSDRRRRWRTAARAEAESRFLLDRQVDRALDVYRDLLGESSPR